MLINQRSRKVILVKKKKKKVWEAWGREFTCHHLLGFIGLHVTVVLSCHFFRAGLRAAGLLRIERVRIVLEDNKLQKGWGWVGGREKKQQER